MDLAARTPVQSEPDPRALWRLIREPSPEAKEFVITAASRASGIVGNSGWHCRSSCARSRATSIAVAPRSCATSSQAALVCPPRFEPFVLLKRKRQMTIVDARTRMQSLQDLRSLELFRPVEFQRLGNDPPGRNGV